MRSLISLALGASLGTGFIAKGETHCGVVLSQIAHGGKLGRFLEKVLDPSDKPFPSEFSPLRDHLGMGGDGTRAFSISNEASGGQTTVRLQVTTRGNTLRIGIGYLRASPAENGNSGMQTRLGELNRVLVDGLVSRVKNKGQAIEVELVAEGVINPQLKRLLERMGFESRGPSRPTTFLSSAMKASALLVKAIDLYAQSGEWLLAGSAMRGVFELNRGRDYSYSFRLEPE